MSRKDLYIKQSAFKLPCVEQPCKCVASCTNYTEHPNIRRKSCEDALSIEVGEYSSRAAKEAAQLKIRQIFGEGQSAKRKKVNRKRDNFKRPLELNDHPGSPTKRLKASDQSEELSFIELKNTIQKVIIDKEKKTELNVESEEGLEFLGAVGGGAHADVSKCRLKELDVTFAHKKFKVPCVKPHMIEKEYKILEIIDGAGGVPKPYFHRHHSIFMEFCNGQTLRSFMKHKGRMIPMKHMIKILLEIVKAVEEVHSRGVIHLDLWEDNVLVEYEDNGFVKVHLVDFGHAQEIGKEAGLYHGKRWPPELLFGRQVIACPEFDIWQLGWLMNAVARYRRDLPLQIRLLGERAVSEIPEKRPALKEYRQEFSSLLDGTPYIHDMK
ncbi:protein kinase C zeta type-like [Macrobrachium nipponense]|uniref:protein kinase C zeta type-like n=1 Tax=Macrobrachium nipponense TaxID=159736 RepID=UPI0030C7DCA7